MVTMRTAGRWMAILTALCCSTMSTSCASGEARRDEDEVRLLFSRFQSSLLRGDRDGVRWLLTRESRAVVDDLPWAELKTRSPLEVLDVRFVRGNFEVRVRDPNTDGSESVYVVAREDSHYRVDLIETVAFNHTEHALEGPATKLRPSRLSPAEIGEIGAREAALNR